MKAVREWLTTSRAAELLGASCDTIRRWCERGYFPDAYQAPGGLWRIPERDVEAFHARRRAGR